MTDSSVPRRFYGPSEWRSGSLGGDTLLVLVLTYPIAVLFRVTPVFYVAAGGVLVAVALIGALKGRLGTPLIRAGLPFYLFILLTFTSTLWSTAPLGTLSRALSLLPFAFIFFTTQLTLRGGIDDWIRKLVIGLPLVVLGSYLWVFLVTGTVRRRGLEVADQFGYISNIGGAMMILCVPYLVHFLAHRGTRRWPVLIALFAVFLGAAISESRAAVILVPMGIVCYLLAARVALRRAVSFAIGLLLLIGLGVGTAVAFGDAQRIAKYVARRVATSALLSPESFRNPEETSADYTRVAMLLEASRVFRDRPATGIGFGAFEWRHRRAGVREIELGSHSILVTAGAELGVAGMLLVIWLAWAGMGGAWRGRRIQGAASLYSAVLVALTLGFVHAQFRSQLKNPVLYVTLGIALAGSRRPTEKRADGSLETDIGPGSPINQDEQGGAT